MPLVPPPPPSDTNGSSGFKMKIGKKKKMKNKNNHSENHDIIPPTMSYEESKESRLPKAYMDTGKVFLKVKFSLVISITFEISCQNLDIKLLQNSTFQTIPNLQ